MSVYVGIDVHRKRSQVAVVNESGEVLANRNVPNRVQPILKVIGGLPPGTPAAFEAAYGTRSLHFSHRQNVVYVVVVAVDVIPRSSKRACMPMRRVS